MNHRRIKDWIEEYVDHTLSPEKTLEIEQHLEDCPECREQVSLTQLTREIILASRLEDDYARSPRFVHSVLAAIEQQKETYLFWSPVRLLAMRAIPLMALLAFILSVLAYTQLVPALSARGSELSYSESYVDLSPTWDQERLMFLNATAQDSERALSPLEDRHSDSSGFGR